MTPVRIARVVTVLGKFIDRNTDKQITIGTTSIKGYSAEEAARIVQSVVDAADTTRRRQLDQEENLLDSTSSQVIDDDSGDGPTVDRH